MSKNEPSNTSSVRALITSVTKCARACKISVPAVYRWIKLNRIPGKYLTTICNLYDVEIAEMIHLTGSEESMTSTTLNKPKGTLAALIEVYRGKDTVESVSSALGVPLRSLKLVMFHWGDELPTLYTTLEQLQEKRITLDEACQRLGVTKYTLHGIRKKYGYAPGAKKPDPLVKQKKHEYKTKRETQRGIALELLSGRLTAKKAMVEFQVPYRSLFRYIERVSEYSLHDLAHWPMSFRAALVEELDKNGTKYIESWRKFVQKHRLVVPKHTKYLETPQSWAELPLKRLLLGVLLGEGTLEEIAASRGGDPSVLMSLFSGDLKPLGLSYEVLMSLSVSHRAAVADILLAILSRKRNLIGALDV